MTLKTEVPISVEHKLHRVYHQHQHYHHYHLHHTLDLHHLHIHNQSVRRSHIESNGHHHYQLPRGAGGEPAAPVAIRAPALAVEEPISITQASHLPPAPRNHHLNLQQQQMQQQQQQQQQQQLAQQNLASSGHQLLQASGLTHLIARHNQREQRILSASHGQQQNRLSVRSKQRSQIQFVLLSAFAYILSPIDLIPEAIFGIFGILDDLVVLFMCLFCVAIILMYPLFREVRRTMFDKLGLKQK